MLPQILPLKKNPRTINGVTLHSLPYPYQAALSICSDIDDCSPALFTAIHQLLSFEEHTPYGEGLGLEVGDSYWLMGQSADVVSYLNNDHTPKSYAKSIRELIEHGWIDSLHTYGDFNKAPAPQRNDSKKFCQLIREEGLSVPVWINHGNTNNTHNLSCRIHDQFSGDDPESEYYHLDELLKVGIRYYWWHELTNSPLSTDIKPNLSDLLSNTAKNVIKSAIGKGNMVKPTAMLENLALPVKMKDGNKLWAFTRYSDFPGDIWQRPGRHLFAHQLTDTFLSRLSKSGGFSILYAHFGQPGWREGDPVLDHENFVALKKLSNLYREKKILVTTTSRLLNFWFISNQMNWSVIENKNDVIIQIDPIINDITGQQILLENDLQGIAFTVPGNKHVIIRLGEKEISNTSNFSRSMKSGVYIPWQKLALPENRFELR